MWISLCIKFYELNYATNNNLKYLYKYNYSISREKMSQLFLKAKNEKGPPPIWLLRQAGRYMPEYMVVRKTVRHFLELCYDSEKACQVTLQPIERYNVDSAIIFSDILVLPDALGWDVQFKEGEGPVLQKYTSIQDLSLLNDSFLDRINNVYEAITKVRNKLNPQISLIGFAGSPWTVASYMIEGKGKHDFSNTKLFIYQNREATRQLIKLLTIKTIEYLSNQVKAGADILMLFDSWAGVLSGSEYDEFVINPTKEIIKSLKLLHPEIPIIGFPRASGYNYDKYIMETGIDIISCDQLVPPEIMAKWQDKIVVQGNLDPLVLLGSQDLIKEKIDDILSKIDRKNFIFNLGHGILPTTDPKNVEFLVNYVRSKYQ